MTDIINWAEQKCASNRLQQALYCPSFRAKTSGQWGDYSFLYGVERLSAASFARRNSGRMRLVGYGGWTTTSQPQRRKQSPSPSGSMGPKDSDAFWPLKKHLVRKWFAADADVKQAVISWLRTLYASFFYAGVQALVLRCDRCLIVSGKCVKVWCVPSATQEPCIHWKQDKPLGINVSALPYFLNLLVFHLSATEAN
jgi:hypothetical protein